jgi:predicted DCC family thiol-disulfide oxidoreductase YuxK
VRRIIYEESASMLNSEQTEIIEVIYDGECPVCSDVVLKRNIENNGYRLVLIDARSFDANSLSSYKKIGQDLNKGMLVTVNGQIFYGHEAMIKLLELSSHNNPLKRLIEHLYSKLNSKKTYPLLVKCRLCLLKILGRKPL